MLALPSLWLSGTYGIALLLLVSCRTRELGGAVNRNAELEDAYAGAAVSAAVAAVLLFMLVLTAADELATPPTPPPKSQLELPRKRGCVLLCRLAHTSGEWALSALGAPPPRLPRLRILLPGLLYLPELPPGSGLRTCC